MADKTLIMKEAQKFLAKGQVDRAIAEWEKLIKEAPDGNVYNIIADLHLKRGDKKSALDSLHKAAAFFRNEGFSLKALALYKKVLNINAADGEALHALGELSEEKGLATDATKYYLAAADAFSKEGAKDRILGIYMKILSLSPTNIPLRIKIAEMFLKEGLRTEAAKEYLQTASMYVQKGELQKAIEFFRKVTEISPADKEALLGISGVHEKSGDMDSAFASLKEAMRLTPDDTDIQYRCGVLCVRTGDYASARAAIEKVMSLDPLHIGARRLLGDIYLREGEREKAWETYLPVIDDMIQAELYEDAVELIEPFRDAEPIETGRRLVSIYRQQGDDTRTAAALVTMGDALRSRDLRAEALGCYRDALRMTPHDDQLRELTDQLAAEVEAEAAAMPQEELEQESIKIVSEGDKSAEEVLVEADIFARYGLLGEAIKLLEGLKARDPQNMELHVRLKGLYAESGEKEGAVTECLILSELHHRRGEEAEADAVLQEATAISPDDPRLAERGVPSFLEPTAYQPEGAAGAEEAGPRIEDYEEEIAEADFYIRQGLPQEAVKILERLSELFPDNRNISERLADLGEYREMTGSAGMTGMFSRMEEVAEAPSEEQAAPERAETFPGPEAAAGEAGATEFEDLSLTEEDLVDAQEMPEPSLDSDVLEIFQEFKKGLEKELGDEDSETHYNLGIAYKEMGLIDDAIKEFQTARSDPKRLLQASTMLGVCYMEKGLYPLAIEALGSVLKELPEQDDAYWSVKYDLAEAHEKNGDLEEARRLLTEVFGWNARFRDVADRLGALEARMPKPAAAPEQKQEPKKEQPRPKKDRVSYL